MNGRVTDSHNSSSSSLSGSDEDKTTKTEETVEIRDRDMNIFLSDENKNDISYEKYIIIQNDALQAENRELIKTLIQLEKEKEEYEKERREYENNHKTMKSVLKNFAEINYIKTLIYDTEKTIKNNLVIYNTNFVSKARKHLKYLECLMIVFIAIVYEYYSHNEVIPLCIFFSIIAAFQESTLLNSTPTKMAYLEENIQEYLSEINEIEHGQHYLQNYLNIIDLT